MSKSEKLVLGQATATRTYSADEIHKRREYSRLLGELIDAGYSDYETVIDRISGPAEPDAFYWHLYYKGTKINGGLVEGLRRTAEMHADRYQVSYIRDIVMASYVWDCETATWIPKAELGL